MVGRRCRAAVNKMPNLDHIPKLHALYCALTGQQITLTIARYWPWECWLKMVAEKNIPPEAALRAVVAHLRRGIRDQRRNEGCLKFSNLIQDLERAEEDLAEALARQRFVPPPAARASVLRATGREPNPKPETQNSQPQPGIPLSDLIAKLRAAVRSLLFLFLP